MVRTLIKQMEEYAKENKVPIMLPDGIEFLEQYIKKHQVKKILELGTAIGYSAIRMACIEKEIRIVTIERDENRFLEAKKNVQLVGLQDQIELKFMDIMDFYTEENFDLIFIDAAKSQYIKFFEKFESNLVSGGTIISDNLNFHGLTKSEEKIESKNLRQLITKIRHYIDYLKENQRFETTFLDIGDGIGISKKK